MLMDAFQMSCDDPTKIRVSINERANEITIEYEGNSISTQKFDDDNNNWLPTARFGNDAQLEQFDYARNVTDAKLCNIFSQKFCAEIVSKEGDCVCQTWRNNMSVKSMAASDKVDYNGDGITRITFRPDLSKFKMQSFNDNDSIELMKQRLYFVSPLICTFLCSQICSHSTNIVYMCVCV